MSTNDDQLRQLDQRAAGAATDLRTRAASRPIPTFDPELAAVTALPTSRPGGRGRALAVAAIVLVLAAVAGVLVAQLGDGGDDSDPAKVITTEPRPFLVGALPEGFTLAGAGEITGDMRQAEGEPRRSGPLTVYGPSADEPGLGIAVLPGWEDSAAESDGVEPVEVGSRTAYRYDGYGLGKRALIIPDGDQAIVVVSPTLTASEVEEAAAEVAVDDDGTIDLGGFDLPDGWREVGRVPDLMASASPLTASANPGSVGKYVLYERNAGQIVESTESTESAESSGSDPASDPESEQGAPSGLLPDYGMLTVSSTQGDVIDVQTTALFADSVAKADVRGHDALVTTSVLLHGDGEQSPNRSITWLEQPGELVRVSGVGLDEDELVAAANSLRIVDGAEWKDLLERSQLGEFDPANAGDPKAVEVGTGRFPDGTRWVLGATPSRDPDYPTPSVELAVAATGGDGSSSSSGTAGGDGSAPLEAIVSTEMVDVGGQRFLGALVGPDVARVELRDAAGKVVAEPEVIEGGGYRGLATVSPSDAVVAVALAADGTELGRSDLLPPDAFEEEGTAIPDGSETATTMASGSGTSSGSSSGSSSGN